MSHSFPDISCFQMIFLGNEDKTRLFRHLGFYVFYLTGYVLPCNVRFVPNAAIRDMLIDVKIDT